MRCVAGLIAILAVATMTGCHREPITTPSELSGIASDLHTKWTDTDRGTTDIVYQVKASFEDTNTKLSESLTKLGWTTNGVTRPGGHPLIIYNAPDRKKTIMLREGDPFTPGTSLDYITREAPIPAKNHN